MESVPRPAGSFCEQSGTVTLPVRPGSRRCSRAGAGLRIRQRKSMVFGLPNVQLLFLSQPCFIVCLVCPNVQLLLTKSATFCSPADYWAGAAEAGDMHRKKVHILPCIPCLSQTAIMWHVNLGGTQEAWVSGLLLGAHHIRNTDGHICVFPQCQTWRQIHKSYAGCSLPSSSEFPG